MAAETRRVSDWKIRSLRLHLLACSSCLMSSFMSTVVCPGDDHSYHSNDSSTDPLETEQTKKKEEERTGVPYGNDDRILDQDLSVRKK